MRCTLISPRIAVQKGDFLGSGVPYWPLELAVLASFLRGRGSEVAVLDLLGLSPRMLEERGDHYLQGRPLSQELDSRGVTDADLFIVYALSNMSHEEILTITSSLRARRPEARIAILENSQAVTAYSLPRVAPDLFAAGADALLCGEPYSNWDEIQNQLEYPDAAPVPDNVLVRTGEAAGVRRRHESVSHYPMPAWDLFALKGYWSLPYSHGPRTKRYLPILTSRGCPFACDFCVLPETSARRWRPRRQEDVVAEMIELRDRFGVRDFQIEDVNPTVNPAHWEAISRLLIERRAEVRFSFVSGTKAETVRLEQVPLLARAGCRYLSFSPESGSPALLRAMGKPFDHEHALALTALCRTHGIATQACFLVGHPAETPGDHRRSCDYLRALVRAGLDEVAVFIVAPLPGSAIHDRGELRLSSDRALVSFSPKGRVDWGVSAARRRELAALFLREKLKMGADLWRQTVRAIAGAPRTKLENLPRRIFCVYTMVLQHRLRGWLETAGHPGGRR